MEMTDIIAKPFDWNDNLSEEAIEDFEGIRKDLSYCTCQNIGMALAKLELLEKQGCKVIESKSEWQQDHEILKAYSDGASAVLDKVRAEIEHVKDNPLFGMVSNDTMLEVIIEIIDKYKAESGDKDADKKCTYKETGCGSCKWQLDCPIEADEAESEEKNEVSVSDKSNP